VPTGFLNVPNVGYLIASFVHALGMTVWLGGIVALGAIVAPTLFRRLPRHEAGALFGPMLRIFEKVSLGAAVFAVTGAAAKAYIAEQNVNLWSVLRYVALFAMCALLFAANSLIHPAIRKVQEANPNVSQLPETDPARMRFQMLHKLSERLMMGQLAFGLVVLLFT
jgi:uncharacterized membrane protein